MSAEVFSFVGIPLAFFFLLDFLVVLISGVLNRRSYQKFAFEYRRFYLKLEDIEDKMDSIALPLLTSEVLFPGTPDLTCDKEEDNND